MTIRKLTSRASLLLFSVFVASCADYDNGYEQKKLEYEKNFKELFGNIDPNQDWNMARQYQESVKKAKNNMDNSIKVESRASATATRYLTGPVSESVSEFACPGTYNNDVFLFDGIKVTGVSRTIVTEEERKAANEQWPERGANVDKFGSVSAYYISDGTPIHVRIIHTATSDIDIMGIYDIENPLRRFPIVCSTEYKTGLNWGIPDFPEQSYYFSYEFIVDIPRGTKYGFYIEGQNYDLGHTHYSQSELNDTENECGKYGVVLSQDGSMVGFEDAHGVEIDYNDIVLHVNPPLKEQLVDVKSWILACEDLGNTKDIDFNDVVLKLEQNNTTLTVTPMAAGGILSSDIYCGGASKGEIHYLLDSSVDNSGDYSFINTESSYSITAEHPFDIDVSGILFDDKPFDIATAFEKGWFRILTTMTDGTYNDINSAVMVSSSNKGNYESVRNSGNAPAMMLLPGNWEWPKERISIAVAYPDFIDWVGDKDSVDWINNRNNSVVIERKGSSTATNADSESQVPSVDYTIDSSLGSMVTINAYTAIVDGIETNGYFIPKSEFAKYQSITSVTAYMYYPWHSTFGYVLKNDGTVTKIHDGFKFIENGVCTVSTYDYMNVLGQVTSSASEGLFIPGDVKAFAIKGTLKESGEAPGQGGDGPGEEGGDFTPVDHDYTSFTAKQVLDISGDFTSGASSAKITVYVNNDAGYIWIGQIGVYIDNDWKFDMMNFNSAGQYEFTLTSEQLSSAISGGIEIWLGEGIVGLEKINENWNK